jgi:hypothetical protein
VRSAFSSWPRGRLVAGSLVSSRQTGCPVPGRVHLIVGRSGLVAGRSRPTSGRGFPVARRSHLTTGKRPGRRKRPPDLRERLPGHGKRLPVLRKHLSSKKSRLPATGKRPRLEGETPDEAPVPPSAMPSARVQRSQRPVYFSILNRRPAIGRSPPAPTWPQVFPTPRGPSCASPSPAASTPPCS